MLLCKNYAMPVKTMIYDAMNYGDQVNEAKKHHQKNKDYKSSDEEKLNDLITKDETFTRVDVETVAAINLFVGTDIKYDENEVQLINVNSKMRKNLFYFLTKKGRTFPLVKISFLKDIDSLGS